MRQDLMNLIDELHEEIQALLETKNVPSLMRLEYKQKVEQFGNMLRSIETMKSLATDEKSIPALVEQQNTILENWHTYEEEMKERIEKEGQ